MELTKYEMETIYNYNQEEPLASCYTMDRALIRRLDALAEKHKEITLLRTGEGMREYTFPKKWIKVPRTKGTIGRTEGKHGKESEREIRVCEGGQ